MVFMLYTIILNIIVFYNNLVTLAFRSIYQYKQLNVMKVYWMINSRYEISQEKDELITLNSF